MQSKKRDKLNRSALGQVFKFDAADLNDNRSGFLSFRQKRKMQIRLALSTAGLLFLIGLAALWAFLMFVVVILHFFDSELEWGFRLFGTVIFLYSIWGALWSTKNLIELWRGFLADFRDARVVNINGEIQLTRIPHHKDPDEMYMAISGQSFELNSSQYDELKDKQNYRLYLAAQSQVILSIEEITESEPSLIMNHSDI